MPQNGDVQGRWVWQDGRWVVATPVVRVEADGMIDIPNLHVDGDIRGEHLELSGTIRAANKAISHGNQVYLPPAAADLGETPATVQTYKIYHRIGSPGQEHSLGLEIVESGGRLSYCGFAFDSRASNSEIAYNADRGGTYFTALSGAPGVEVTLVRQVSGAGGTTIVSESVYIKRILNVPEYVSAYIREIRHGRHLIMVQEEIPAASTTVYHRVLEPDSCVLWGTTQFRFQQRMLVNPVNNSILETVQEQSRVNQTEIIFHIMGGAHGWANADDLPDVFGENDVGSNLMVRVIRLVGMVGGELVGGHVEISLWVPTEDESMGIFRRIVHNAEWHGDWMATWRA
jgi:hypothetical protein